MTHPTSDTIAKWSTALLIWIGLWTSQDAEGFATLTALSGPLAVWAIMFRKNRQPPQR